MYGFCYHFNSLHFKSNATLMNVQLHMQSFGYVSSELILKGWSFKWSLDHPSRSRDDKKYTHDYVAPFSVLYSTPFSVLQWWWGVHAAVRDVLGRAALSRSLRLGLRPTPLFLIIIIMLNSIIVSIMITTMNIICHDDTHCCCYCYYCYYYHYCYCCNLIIFIIIIIVVIIIISIIIIMFVIIVIIIVINCYQLLCRVFRSRGFFGGLFPRQVVTRSEVHE